MEQNTIWNLAKDVKPIWTGAASSGPVASVTGEDEVAKAFVTTFYCPSRRAPTGYGVL